MKHILLAGTFAALFLLTACAETQFGAHVAKQVTKDTRSQGTYKVGNPYYIMGTQYFPEEKFEHAETGIASWYGPGFHGKQTANGETYDQEELTAAHRTLQMPSLVRVTNLENGRSIVVRVNDRGPYSKGRVIDLSSKAAELLSVKGRGTAKVKIEVLPEESRRIAEDARRGMDTRGYEVALNSRGQYQPVSTAAAASAQTTTVTTVTQFPSESGPAVQVAYVESEVLMPPSVPGHVSNDGHFLPDPVVTQRPVPASTNIYVQAGSFGDPANADRLSTQLSAYGPSKVVPAQVGGRQFYRVRLGPFPEVAQADAALNNVLASGTQKAVIVVE